MPHGIGLYSAHSMTAGGPGFMLPIGCRTPDNKEPLVAAETKENPAPALDTAERACARELPLPDYTES